MVTTFEKPLYLQCNNKLSPANFTNIVSIIQQVHKLSQEIRQLYNFSAKINNFTHLPQNSISTRKQDKSQNSPPHCQQLVQEVIFNDLHAKNVSNHKPSQSGSPVTPSCDPVRPMGIDIWHRQMAFDGVTMMDAHAAQYV